MLLAKLFTTRDSGVSEPPFDSLNLAFHVGDDPAFVAVNRLKVAAPPIAFMNQVHGSTVVVVDSLSPQEPTADAMITQTKNLALAVMVADCIPLLLWDKALTTIAAVHVGRRGLVNGVALSTLNLMKELGAIDVCAEIGPSICGKCYEVGADIFDEVVSGHPSAASTTVIRTKALDLPRALENVLRAKSVEVSRSSQCTVENAHYFSYRRAPITGRQAGLIWLS